MPGAAVKLGPFSAGLNNVGEIGTIPDNALADMVNFEIDVDGTLVSRPAIIVEDGAPPSADLIPHGYYVRNDGETYSCGTTKVPVRSGVGRGATPATPNVSGKVPVCLSR